MILWVKIGDCGKARQGPCHLSDQALQGVACGYYCWQQDSGKARQCPCHLIVTGPCRALPTDIIVGDKAFWQSPARPSHLVTGPCRALPADIVGDKAFRQSPARPSHLVTGPCRALPADILLVTRPSGIFKALQRPSHLVTGPCRALPEDIN